MERLVCYDERAREYLREHGMDVTNSPQPPSAQAVRKVAVPLPNENDIPEVATIDPPSPKAVESEENFGRRGGASAPKQLTTRIESITKAALGNYVMTLSNGQIWSENEPSGRRIKAEQKVTITKKRFRYEMRLESGRTIPVRRIDTG